ncbi:GGDEF domain-containing protein [Pseudoroseicyclus tamaricis]|uniref:diguanylate cyclase n=1 Tax=Pseudoroseicyclus tamaricis TaxID=2705421 RepID=A0A6B2JSR4_9RHOB|nr:GGDEF domain-containing protein [Pseudoroseicyclus tamaricis]NDU99608.1 GGDEF domain-containing protein [Pseudoroseicyclus tamaricis]
MAIVSGPEAELLLQGVAIGIEHLPACLVVADSTGQVLFGNQAARRAGVDSGEVLLPASPGSFAAAVALTRRTAGRALLSLRCPDRGRCVARALFLRQIDSQLPLYLLEIDKSGLKVTGAADASSTVGGAAEVQALRDEAARLRRLCQIDRMTGLLNAVEFEEQVQAELALEARENRSAAFLYLDVNDFKKTNDNLGHDAGDAVLRSLAGCLREVTRDDDLIGRTGGDEFCILIRQIDPEDIAALTERIRQCVARPVEVSFSDGRVVVWLRPCIAVGAVPVIGTGHTIEALRGEAEMAMYADKRKAKSVDAGAPGKAETACRASFSFPVKAPHSNPGLMGDGAFIT